MFDVFRSFVALESIKMAAAKVEAETPSSVVINFVRNSFFDPVLDRPEFIEVRGRVLTTIP